MWPSWAFYSMAMLAMFLFGILLWPAIRFANVRVACWWIRRRERVEHAKWEASRSERMREVFR